MDERRCSVNVFIGAPGHGKTTYLKQVMRSIPKKKLVLDMAEKDFNHYGLIPEIGMLAKWKKNNKRVTMSAFKMGDDFAKLFIENVTLYVRDSAILMEDTTGYMKDRHTDLLKFPLSMRRHHNNDWFFAYHGFDFVDQEIVHLADYITIFKTPESIDYFKTFKKFPNRDVIMKAMMKIEAKYSPDPKNPNHYLHYTIKTMK